jgi:beta-lactamase class A
MKQIVEVAGFSGLMDVYMQDLRTGEDLHFAQYQGTALEVDPDIAFTAASIIKIGIMTSYYRYFDEPLDEERDRWMFQMITESGNDPADWLMEDISPATGPLQVSETMAELGLDSTFLAGYFRLGSDLLKVYQTPANQRADINTRPDIYNQTTPSEIGMLLADIYACAKGGGTLLAIYPEEIKPAECQKMLDMLAQNQIALLIEAGVPEGTRVAHKHGWTNSPLDTVADAGIVFSPGGDYAIAIFLWNDPDMIWDPTSKLVADLARAAYNYFNPPVVPASSSGG